MTHKKEKIKGAGIVEAIVAISVASIAFASLLTAGAYFIRGGLFATDQAQALFLLDESVEVVRFLRDDSYSMNITPLIGAGPMHLVPSTHHWSATTTHSLVHGRYTRTIEIEEVYRRNSDDDIVPASSAEAKYVDPGTVLLTIHIAWGGGALESATFVTDLYEN